MDKKCNKCNIIKKFSEFRLRSDTGRFRNNCKECESIQKKKIYYKNHKKYLAQKKEYRDNPFNRLKRCEWEKKARVSNPHHKLRGNLRTRLNRAICKGYKKGSAVRDLGCSIEELKVHLENMFYSHPVTGEKMSWENWSVTGWHIDHIKPLAGFDLTDESQLKRACHYTNLQPMWHDENIKKGNK